MRNERLVISQPSKPSSHEVVELFCVDSLQLTIYGIITMSVIVILFSGFAFTIHADKRLTAFRAQNQSSIKILKAIATIWPIAVYILI